MTTILTNPIPSTYPLPQFRDKEIDKKKEISKEGKKERKRERGGKGR